MIDDILDFSLETNHDPVVHPSQCLEIIENLNFCLGSAIDLIWRAASAPDAIEDLEKAQFFITREIARRKTAKVEKR